MSLMGDIGLSIKNRFSGYVSIPTSYHIYNGEVTATNTVVTNGFSTTLHTGNGGTQSINTDVDMSTQWGNDASETFGGLVWLKGRSAATNNFLFDTIRGTTKEINSNTTEAEATLANSLTAFTSTGMTLGSAAGINTNTATYASWNFQTTHRKTGITNHGKAYTEHYNPFTGFTIIKYEGSGLAGHEIPHGLGRKLSLNCIKNLSIVSDWIVQKEDNSVGYLNLTNTFIDMSPNISNSRNETSITLGINSYVNASTNQYILYGWANSYYDEKNKLIGNYEIGTYVGTGAAGNKVTTKGKPAWVMTKQLSSTGNWLVVDNLRVSGSNDGRLYANLSDAEIITSDAISLQSDGFILNEVGSDSNTAGGQYLYMVVYDNDSGSGKSKYPRATDTTNLSINALVPYSNGIDTKGSKVSISYKNETITGVTLSQGKNYPYSKNDGTYGVSKYAPMYGTLRNRVVAGENPDYFDLGLQKWFSTTGGSELVTNGTFDINTSGWTAINSTLSIVNNTLRVTTTSNYGGAYQTFTNLVVGKTYRYKLIGSLVTSNTFIIRVAVPPFTSYDYQSALQTVSGSVYIDFVALYTTMAIEFVFGSTTGVTGSIDNVSVFEVTPTIGSEILPRTYLDCIAYADQNGQVEYVEQIAKTTYITDLKVTDSFDLGQTWKDMTASRTAGVTYTNSTGKPIYVMLKIAATNYNTYCSAALTVGSMNFFVASNEGVTIANSIVSAIVPNNTTYSYTIGAGYASFFELR